MNIYVIATIALLVVLGFIRSKQAKNKVVRVIEENCTGCNKCVKRCRPQVLEVVKSGMGKRVVVLTNPKKCTACNHCVAACKFKALEMVDRKGVKEVKVV